jgi:hypothetical protein
MPAGSSLFSGTAANIDHDLDKLSRSFRKPRFQGITGRLLSDKPTIRPSALVPCSMSALAIYRQLTCGIGKIQQSTPSLL